MEKNIAIIVPSYKPDKEIMMDFIKKLKEEYEKIVVIDDGSGDEFDSFFKEIEELNIKVLKHNINLGKGRAIKNAFNYILNEYKDVIGTITADCDGQHYIEDIINVGNSLKKTPDKLVIGCRQFNEKQVPWKSRAGNKITRTVFLMFVGIKITDTQTGLRGYGKEIMKKFLSTSGERYEYETNMLIECKEKEIEIEEVPIQTVYIRNNSLSHFDALRDSWKIYKLFMKYILSSLGSFVVDILLFSVFVKALPDVHLMNNAITTIVLATIIARIISSLFNFVVNSKVVFKNSTKSSILKYFILVVVQMLVSAFVVSGLAKVLNISSTGIKIIVDIIIFIVNFIIQREFIFKK